MFLETLMFKVFSADKQSLNDHCLSLLFNNAVSIRKQSFDSRFSDEATEFVKRLVENQIQSITSIDNAFSIKGFNKVCIQDSTRFGLPDAFENEFKSFGGRSSKAGMQIQFSYDLLRHKIHTIDIDSASVNDRSYAVNNDWIEKDDLVIRDLGYFSMDGFKQIQEKDSFFLSRAYPRTALFEKHSGKLIRLDLDALIRKMETNNIELIEKNIYCGLDQKMPMRAIIQRLPPELKEKRLRQKRRRAAENKSKSAMSKDYALWAGINVYLTNTSSKDLPAKQAKDIYSTRWQIELVFKTWKSFYQIDKFKTYKINRMKFYIYTSLLLALIHWQVFGFLQKVVFQQYELLLSLHKYVKYMLHLKTDWIQIIRSRKDALIGLIKKTVPLIDQYLIKEKKKNKNSIYSLLKDENTYFRVGERESSALSSIPTPNIKKT